MFQAVVALIFIMIVGFLGSILLFIRPQVSQKNVVAVRIICILYGILLLGLSATFWVLASIAIFPIWTALAAMTLEVVSGFRIAKLWNRPDPGDPDEEILS